MPLSLAESVSSAPPEPAGEAVELDAEGQLVHPLLAAPPVLSLFRATTDNDRMAGLTERWLAQGLAQPVPGPATVERDGPVTRVRREVRVATVVVEHSQVFTPLAGGGVHVAEEAVIPLELSDLPRVGTELVLVPGLVDAEWFGLGPHETYPDRKRSGLVGRWRSAIDDLFVPYLWPQEAGGRADVRWLELLDASGGGVRIDLDVPSQVSANRYTAADLESASHLDELTPRAETIVHLDAAHRGLGTASCGPDTTEDYLVRPGTYRWGWSLRALPAGGDAV